MFNVIGIVGKARSGKDTAAKVLTDMNPYVVRRALADSLREDLVAMGFGEDVGQFMGNDRHPLRRRLLQIWGTEHARAFDSGYWFHRWASWCLEEHGRNAQLVGVVIPDIRFPDEAERVMGKYLGHLLFIDADERLGGDQVPAHASEDHYQTILGKWGSHHRFMVVRNDVRLGQFQARCEKVFQEWGYDYIPDK